MKPKQVHILLIIFAFLFFFTSTNAQVEYVPGTITDTAGNKTNCLIRFVDRRYNPVKVEYKLSENGTVYIGNVDGIKEFEITGNWRFVTETVRLDTSSSNFIGLSHQREPEWSIKKIFLKVLVEGKASLYYFENNQYFRFFFSINGSKMEQLVYKEYYTTPAGDNISENNLFRQQLWINLPCPGSGVESVESITYRSKDLISYFKKYNEYQDAEFHVFVEKKKEQRFFLSPFAAICITSLMIQDNYWLHYTLHFESKPTLLIGLDAEYILPFNRNKWGIVLAPEFQQYRSEGMFVSYSMDVVYRTIEFPAGIRYHILFKNDMQISVNAFYVPELVIDMNSALNYNEVEVEFNPKNSLAFGAGYSYRKLSAEFRYYFPKSISNSYPVQWKSRYQKFGLLFRYTLW